MKLPVLLKREVPSPEDTPPKSGSSPWKKRLLRKRVLIPAVACVVALSLGIHFFGGGQTALAADLTYTTAAVERRDITSEVGLCRRPTPIPSPPWWMAPSSLTILRRGIK